MDPIFLKSIQAIPEPFALKTPKVEASSGPGFGDLLTQAVEQVNRMQHEAGRLEDAVARGEDVNIHQAVIAGEKAGLSFQLMTKVRNKLIDAYEEIMRMQV
ncbi:MAG: flagellar hook-basal body complex protein FliE [Nitrospira sp.]|nr:flagellar hook-basal body complex protein FliE [Nitrospira sp.]MCA9481866.1 flagellar hook-basal body complex protein FliE [Nitrospira sp.]